MAQKEYCADCDELIEDCECDDGPTLTEVLDGAKKFIDVAKGFKELTTPNPNNIIAELEVGRMAAEHERKQKLQEIELQKERKIERKWKIGLAVKIGVPITVAVISAVAILSSI